MDDAGFRALTAKIALERGFGCTNYRDGCLRRRIAVRMRARGTPVFALYSALLDSDPAEYELLLDALTINVTKLYRDAAAWDVIATDVLPSIFALDPNRTQIWSAGCASGEELYTLAAIVHRHAESSGEAPGSRRVRIVGTDIDRGSLDAARLGKYGSDAFGEMPISLRDRYFSATSPHAAVPELREMVRVERRDLLSEPALAGGQHLITCRNVIIYFGRPSQEPLIRKFHDALVPGGFLVLGKVETLMGPTRALFETVDARNRIFRRALS